MTNEEIQQLLRLREFAMQFYHKLGSTWQNAPAALMKTQEAGRFSSSVAKSIEDILKNYVNFED